MLCCITQTLKVNIYIEIRISRKTSYNKFTLLLMICLLYTNKLLQSDLEQYNNNNNIFSDYGPK